MKAWTMLADAFWLIVGGVMIVLALFGVIELDSRTDEPEEVGA